MAVLFQFRGEQFGIVAKPSHAASKVLGWHAAPCSKSICRSASCRLGLCELF